MGGKGKGGVKGGKGKGAPKGMSKGDAMPKGKGKGKVEDKGKGKGKGKEAPAAALGDLLPVGSELTAMFSDGAYYKATVVQVRKKAPEIKVNYNGYDSSCDAWVGTDEIRSKALKGMGKGGAKAAAAPEIPAVGATCQAQTYPDGQFFPAEVIETSTTKARARAPVKVKVAMWLPMIALRAIQKPKAAAPEPSKGKGKGKGKAEDVGKGKDKGKGKGKGKGKYDGGSMW